MPSGPKAGLTKGWMRVIGEIRVPLPGIGEVAKSRWLRTQHVNRVLPLTLTDEDEYLPLGADTFFVKSDLGSLTFSRDAQGHVTGYTYHFADGQEVHSKKIR